MAAAAVAGVGAGDGRRDVTKVREDYPPLTDAQIERLAEELAFWLVDNGQSDCSADDIDAFLDSHLRNMQPPGMRGHRVRALLVDRCSLMHEVMNGGYSFVHRTLQEYLAAKKAIDDRSIPRIVQLAVGDQWREMVIIASGLAKKKECERLLKQLIVRGDKNARRKRQWYLLALACLETAVEVDPEVRNQVIARALTVLPPKDASEAKLVATAGTPAASLLTLKQRHSAVANQACVLALSEIGGEEALKALATYRTDESYPVALALGQAWSSFDRGEFAEKVLVGRKSLGLSDTRDLADLGRVRDLNHLYLQDSAVNGDLALLSPLRELTYLQLRNISQETNLRPLRYLPALTELSLGEIHAGVDLSPLADLATVKTLSFGQTHGGESAGAYCENR